MTQSIHPVLERVAKQIARANGDEFANAFTNKSRWVAKRGMSGGRYRDVNEPYQHDYIDMARAAIQALLEPNASMLDAWASAVPYWGEEAIRKGHQAMLKPLLGDEGTLPQSEQKPQPVPGVYGPDQHAAGFVAKEVG